MTTKRGRSRKRSRAIPPAAEPPASPLVLLVDDGADNRDIYAEYLAFVGFRVTQAASGPEALVRAREELPHAIVLDVHMPVMDGFEVARRMRADVRTASVPIVMVSGDPRAATQPGAATCDRFMVKPCLPEELAAELHVLLRER